MIIGAIACIGLFFFRRSNAKSWRASTVYDEAASWLSNEEIKPSSVQLSAYHEPALAKNPGASVVVGFGDRTDGSPIGFVLEVTHKAGVIEGIYLDPYGIATHHSVAAQAARLNGRYLMDTMKEMANQHRAKHSVV